MQMVKNDKGLKQVNEVVMRQGRWLLSPEGTKDTRTNGQTDVHHLSNSQIISRATSGNNRPEGVGGNS